MSADSTPISRAGLSIHVEEPEDASGGRLNRQVRALGHAQLENDRDGAVTRDITLRYLSGPGAKAQAIRRAATSRVLIRLRPIKLIAVAGR